MKSFSLIVIVGIYLVFPVSSFAEQIFSFQGQLDFFKNQADFVFDFQKRGSLRVRVIQSQEDEYQINLSIEHLKTPLFDLASEIAGELRVKRGEQATPHALYGKFSSHYTLIDYKPVRELAGRFEIKNKTFYLTSLAFGNVTGRGEMKLVYPYEINMAVDLSSVEMVDFLHFWVRNNTYDSNGLVNGQIKASGSLGRLLLQGKLMSEHGFINEFKYDYMSLNIEGIYPNMRLIDSMISMKDGLSFSVNGPVHLGDQGSFKTQVNALAVSPLVKDSGSKSEWTIKRSNEEESVVTEIKYLKRKELPSGTSTEEETHMLGIEQTLEF